MALKIACTQAAARYFATKRKTVDPAATDFTDVAAAVLTMEDAPLIRRIDATCFKIPVFLIKTEDEPFDDEEIGSVYRIMDTDHFDKKLYSRQIEAAAVQYETNLLPPFLARSNPTWRKAIRIRLPRIRAASISGAIPWAGSSMNFSAKIFSARISAMPT